MSNYEIDLTHIQRVLKHQDDINTIVNWNRQKGNTTWIIKGAVINPGVIIVSASANSARFLKEKYFDMLKDLGIEREKHPVFATMHDNLHGLNLPVVFDNSALFA